MSADKVIVALDRATPEANLALVEQLAGRARWFKVGMRLFYAGGRAVIDAIRAADAKLFLDLKLHDIPATVGGAMGSLAPFEPELLTIHASGGAAMVAAAREAAPATTRLLAVTVLTSLGEQDVEALGWAGGTARTVERWARLAVDAGADGLVCSGHEAGRLRAALGGEPLLVTPGIRPAGAAAGDQQRVMTPARALGAGSSLLVIGRPIHAAPDPVAAFDAIADECAAGAS